jgi:hypothetical protein
MMSKKVIVVASIVVLLMIAGILAHAYFSNGLGKSPPNIPIASTTKGPAFVTDTLINDGVTSQQLSNLEQVLGQYLSSQNQTPRQVSFISIQRQPTNPDTTIPFSEITFVIQLDGKEAYQAKMDSYSLSEISLYIYSPDGGNLLYDVQDVGSSSGQS